MASPFTDFTDAIASPLTVLISEAAVAPFTENDEAIMAATSVFTFETVPVALALTIDLYEAWSGSPPELAF